MSDIVLYRCPTRTNVLCPCGAVARRLGKLELSYRTERVPYRRNSRPEIEELTRQHRVPVLVDGDEIVHDSKRIIQYLNWKYGGEESKQDGRKQEKDEKSEKAGRKAWRKLGRKGRKKQGKKDEKKSGEEDR